MNGEYLKEALTGVDNELLNILVREHRDKLSMAFGKVNADVKDDAKQIAPHPRDVFRAFRACRWASLRVVIMGQDPYPTAGDADGMAFSSRALKTPASLAKIWDCLLHNKLITQRPNHSRLDSWAEQGVLLLNAALTTRVGHAEAHAAFWTEYTDAVLRSIVKAKPDVIVCAWGTHAKKRCGWVKDLVTWGHPSPASPFNRQTANAKNFTYCDNFQVINERLRAAKLPLINWNLPDIIPRGDEIPIAQEIVPPQRDVLYIGADGAASGNGKDGCKAAWAFHAWCNGESLARQCGPVSCGDTNNRGELEAAINAIRWASTNNPRGLTCVVVTDSKYTIGCLSTWARKWIAEGTKDKKNLDIIVPAIGMIDSLKFPLQWDHVPGHMPEPPARDSLMWLKWYLNDSCDKAATSVHGGGTAVPPKPPCP